MACEQFTETMPPDTEKSMKIEGKSMTNFKKLGPWVHAPHRGGSKAEGMRKLGGSTGKKVSSP